MSFPRLEQCELCGSSDPLQRSHIIPAFAYRYVMAGTGRFYCATAPRKFVQGGERVHLLCQRCESHISFFERDFQKLFFPDGKPASLPLQYGPTLYRFCCSVSWRVLTHLKLSAPPKHRETSNISTMLLDGVAREHHAACEETLNHWASTILNGVTQKSDQHIVFLNGKLVPFERTDIVGFHIFQTRKDLATVAIFGPILLLGFVRRGSGWQNTEVNSVGGDFPIVAQSIPIEFARWMHDLYFNLERVAR